MKSSFLTTGLILLATLTANANQPAVPPKGKVVEKPSSVSKNGSPANAEDKQKSKKKKEEAYNPIGKRDPFTSFVVELQKISAGSHSHPLQKFQLAQLKLIGVVVGIPHPKAMFEDPAGKAWIVGNGTHIGKNFGKIKQITKENVVVVEEYHDPSGGLTLNEVVVKLYQGSGEVLAEKKKDPNEMNPYGVPSYGTSGTDNYGASSPSSSYNPSSYGASAPPPMYSDSGYSSSSSPTAPTYNDNTYSEPATSTPDPAPPAVVNVPETGNNNFDPMSDNMDAPPTGGN